MGTYNKFISKEALEKFYVEDELSSYEVAAKFKVSQSVILRRLKRYNLKVRKGGSKKGSIPYNKNKIIIKCKECSKIFEVSPYRKDKAKFCSYQCYWDSIRWGLKKKIRVCKICGEEFIDKHFHRSNYCSKKCRTIGMVKTIVKTYTNPKKYTSLERTIKYKLEKNKLNFKHNKRFRKYIVDFFLPDYDYIIEVDGYFHKFDKKEKVRRRDNYLLNLGYSLEHIPQEEVQNWEPILLRQK